MNVKAGDMIKSYDFSKELRPDTYMIGLVENVTEQMIECKIVEQVFAGDVIERPEALSDALFRTPKQGLGMFDDRDTRIELVATAADLRMIAEEHESLF